jgi:peptidoglycan hydrolase CwlO-like protein
MKRKLLFIPLAVTVLFAFGCTNTSQQVEDAADEQTEEIEKTIKDLDEVIDSSSVEVEKLQGEIDELLKEI